jgi:hypothetical protein
MKTCVALFGRTGQNKVDFLILFLQNLLVFSCIHTYYEMGGEMERLVLTTLSR